MSYDSSIFGAEDADSVEQSNIKFPVIQFKTGDSSKAPTKKNPADPGISWRGGFFIEKDAVRDPDDNQPVDLTEYGWLADSFISKESGEEVEGYYAPMISVCHIEYRRSWTVGRGKEVRYFPWNANKQAKEAGTPRGLMQSIVLVKGLERFGPFCLSMRGHVQMAYKADHKDYLMTGVMSSFRRTVLQKAMDVNKEKAPKGVAAAPAPYYGFWMSMEASTDSKGEPKFFEVGASDKYRVVLPVPVGLPADAKEVNLDDFFVGDAVVYKAREIRSMLAAEGWKEALNNLDTAKPEPAKAPAMAVAANYAEEAGV